MTSMVKLEIFYYLSWHNDHDKLWQFWYVYMLFEVDQNFWIWKSNLLQIFSIYWSDCAYIWLLCLNRVKLEGRDSSTLHVQGHVVEGSLMLLSDDLEEPIECVRFGSTYYGTDCTQSAVLYNNGPEPVCFVVILDEDATGQELVRTVPFRI